MLRLDGRSYEEIAELIRWATDDEFWLRNILSMDKLREKFDQLQLNQRSNGKAHPPEPPVRSAWEKTKELMTHDLPKAAHA